MARVYPGQYVDGMWTTALVSGKESLRTFRGVPIRSPTGSVPRTVTSKPAGVGVWSARRRFSRSSDGAAASGLRGGARAASWPSWPVPPAGAGGSGSERGHPGPPPEGAAAASTKSTTWIGPRSDVKGIYRSSLDARKPQNLIKSEDYQGHPQGVLYST
eukprot:332364-Prorocentrum_minimum.AAC.2